MAERIERGVCVMCTNMGTIFESKGYSNALKAAESKIYKDAVETAFLLDKKGNTIFIESSGATNAVYFTPEQVAKMKGANLTHNHPSNSTFSPEDIKTLTTSGLNSIRATGIDRTYQLSVIKGSVQRNDFSSAYQAAMVNNKKVTDKVYKKYEKQYNSGKITYTEFQSEMPELNNRLNGLHSDWLKKNAESYGYRYSVIERR